MPSSTLAFPETDPAVAASFASLWHGWHSGVGEGSGGFVSVFSLPGQQSLFVPVSELGRVIIDNGLDELTYVGGGQGPQNLYHSVGVYGKRPTRGRGRAADVAWAPGVWLDCDVKLGGFENEGQIFDLVRALDGAGLPPQIAVRTGPGGGHHLYWRTERPLLGEEIEEWALRIWLYASSLLPEGVSIDRLVEPNRVMRLPGSLWWPKPGSVGGAGTGGGGEPVRMVRGWDEGALSLADLEAASRAPWERWRQARAEAQKRRRESLAQVVLEWSDDEDVLDAAGGVKIGKWGMLSRLELWEAEFNLDVSWDQILVPAGWVRTNGPDAEGRVSWMRPGEGRRNPRSLVTDWDGSPHVAKLMSDAPETRLLHLEAAGLPMTKLNVMAALYFNDNTHETLLRWYKARRAGRGQG